MLFKKEFDTADMRRAVPERHIFHFTAVVAAIMVLSTSIVAAYEITTFPKAEPKKAHRLKAIGIPVIIKPPTPPVDLLPEHVLQYETKMRQPLLAGSYPAGEAMYEFLNATMMLERPMNTYAKVIFFPSVELAKKDINETLAKRYPNKHKNVVVGNTVVATGYDEQEGGYFMGWTKQSFSIKVYTSFTRGIPADKKTSLQDHAMPIVKAIESGRKRSIELD